MKSDRTPAASAALRRTSAGPSRYVMELGLLNTGDDDLTGWQAAITLPEGAGMAAGAGAAVEETAPGAYTVRPHPGAPLAPGHRQMVSVEVYGTLRAPTSATFSATAGDGATVQAAVAVVAAVTDGDSREADESTWPGSTGVGEQAPATGNTGGGGGAGLGGGGGGGATSTFRVHIEWENDSGGGGGAGGGGGVNQGGAGSDGRQGGDWQQYQNSYQNSAQDGAPASGKAGANWQQQYRRGSSPATGGERKQAQEDPLDEIKAELRALGERVADLEGGKP
ncbi:hypothetical protein Sme01_31460 [Sphaerisporangium melleum]|uniref:CBM2 domain-containing protein n=1 Tax=Sphaerisporangium melleum TaxID=321316 RepID=A0A917R9F5_9ACTN|nr:hypothetical protein [Sphaerisporangium melleum]GGK96020.1 hypothetical protein GCM10007964_42880 [Sphaerisporangium melleum]GII70670.1 hypothetical protein Sme01_31460 [Sphaerisporangium melleum]